MSAEHLSGLKILVTRPAAQCRALCRLIDERGGEGIPWPAIEIEPCPPEEHARELLGAAKPRDLAIFVSRNAVLHGSRLLPDTDGPTIAAIGPSTHAALERSGLTPDIRPRGFDSESLLADPRLESGKIRRVFIIRGAGGRELLGDTLRQRGCPVTYVDVYRRRKRVSSQGERTDLLLRWRKGGVDLYTATSVQLLQALYDDLGDEFGDLLRSTPLVTASRRVVQRSEELRHRAERILAPGPDDRSLVEAIASWRGRSQHPADRPESR
jgi:uroporphyrinogen-III synthase